MQNEDLSPEERRLFKTRDVPYNREQRRRIAKQAKVDFKTVRPGMAVRNPTMLGIRHTKKNSHAGIDAYKAEAWKSKQELDAKRAMLEFQANNPNVEIVERSDVPPNSEGEPDA